MKFFLRLYKIKNILNFSFFNNHLITNDRTGLFGLMISHRIIKEIGEKFILLWDSFLSAGARKKLEGNFHSNSVVQLLTCRGMHNPSYNESLPFINITIIDKGIHPNPEVNLVKLIKDKIKNHERFYGIEISARSSSISDALDYGAFKTEPLFTSITWIERLYSNIESISEVPTIKCANYLRKQSKIVMPHITCFKMTPKKLDQFLFDDYKNILILRGDNVHDDQKYNHAVDLIQEIRNRKKDDFSITVAGYPEVHPLAKSKQEDLQFLKEKIDAGSDMIITQSCYSPEVIIDFIKDCRQIGIEVPIVPGVHIAKNFNSLNHMCKLTEICPPAQDMKEYVKLQHDDAAFEEFALSKVRKLLSTLFESDEKIYGVQFFTMNYFNNIVKIVKEFF